MSINSCKENIMDTKEYKCPRCGYSTNTKTNYKIHLKSAQPCLTKFANTPRDELIAAVTTPKKTPTRECLWCKKMITCTNFSRHKGNCPSRPTVPPVVTNNDVNQPINENHNTDEVTPINEALDITKINNDTQATIASLVEQLTRSPELLKTIAQFIQPYTTSITNNTNNTFNIVQNNQNNVVLNTFGNEDTSHLAHEFLSHCLMNPTKGITHLIDSIHYNPDVPANHNVRHKSTKKNTMEKFIDAHWTECDASNTLDELIRKGYRILNAHYAEHFMNDPSLIENEIKQKAMERFRFLSDKKSNDYYSVKRDLRLLIKDRTVYVIEAPINNEVV